MADDRRGPRVAAALALTAAFLWASYYAFVLLLAPRVPPSATFALPFVTGGIGYTAWTFYRGQGRAWLALWTLPSSYLRIGLLLSMQVAILAGAYLAGPVDTSLLSLLGDVVVTPVLVMAAFGSGRERARSLAFVGGLVLSLAGSSLTILGNGEAQPLRGVGWALVAAIPVSVAFYFLLCAQANRFRPANAVVGQTTAGAAIGGILLAPLVPGGVGGLAVADPLSWGLLAALGLTSFFVGPMLYFHAIERAGLILPALLMASIPVFTLGLATAVTRVLPPALAIAGIPVAVLGAALALQGSHPPWTPEYLRQSRPSPPPDPAEPP